MGYSELVVKIVKIVEDGEGMVICDWFVFYLGGVIICWVFLWYRYCDIFM